MPTTTNLSNKPIVGVLIVEQLNNMGKNQKWLADNTDLTYAHICKIVSGKCKPTLPTINKISSCINIEAKEILLAVHASELRKKL